MFASLSSSLRNTANRAVEDPMTPCTKVVNESPGTAAVESTHLLLALCQALLERPLQDVDRVDLVVLQEQLVLDVLVPRQLSRAVCDSRASHQCMLSFPTHKEQTYGASTSSTIAQGSHRHDLTILPLHPPRLASPLAKSTAPTLISHHPCSPTQATNGLTASSPIPTLKLCSGSFVSRSCTTFSFPFHPPSSPTPAFGIPYAPFLKTRFPLRATLSVVPKKAGRVWAGYEAEGWEVRRVARSALEVVLLEVEGFEVEAVEEDESAAERAGPVERGLGMRRVPSEVGRACFDWKGGASVLACPWGAEAEEMDCWCGA